MLISAISIGFIQDLSANDTFSGLEAKVEEAVADDDLNEVLGEKIAVGGSSEATPAPAPAGNPFREGDVDHEDSGDKDEVDNEVQGDKVTRNVSMY